MKRSLLSCLLVIAFFSGTEAQQNYCNFETTKVITFGGRTGVLDSLFMNPAPDPIDSTTFCAKYVRDSALYDYIKVYPDTMLTDVTPYLDNNVQTPRISMKLYSTAPVGTMVQVQLGISSVDNYPA